MKSWRQKIICACFWGVLPLPSAWAVDYLPADRSLAGIRSKGLGVPSVALTGAAQGETALQNPSWIGVESRAMQKNVLRGLYFPAVTLGANGTTRSLGRAYFGGRGSTQTSIENFLKAAQNEQTPYALFEMYPSVTLWRVQWGLFARAQVEGYVWQPSAEGAASSPPSGSPTQSSRISTDVFSLVDSSSQMSVQALVERGTSVSLSTPYKNTGLTLGVTVRPTWRSEYSGDVTLSEPLASETAKDLRAKFNETRAVPVDFALNVRIPRWTMKPSMGIKLEDVGDTYYRGANPSHQTVVKKTNLSVGVAGWLFQGKKVSSQCTVAGQNLNDDRVAKSSAVGAGCEILVNGQTEGDVVANAPLVLRFGGTKDGLAYGLSWDMPFAILEVGSNVASVNGPLGSSPRSDRRYFLRLSVDANEP